MEMSSISRNDRGSCFSDRRSTFFVPATFFSNNTYRFRQDIIQTSNMGYGSLFQLRLFRRAGTYQPCPDYSRRAVGEVRVAVRALRNQCWLAS